MIPSLVAEEVQVALRDFLSTQFQPSNQELSTVIDDFLSEKSNFIKGPYLSVALPFQRVPEGGEPFPRIPLGLVPYRHQRTAFERLADGRSTVVATGTGSGKTECFLYPILDWCRRHAGQRGIKAIIIYPMNALATDQAGRIARIIDQTPALRGKVTAGIYIGGAASSPQWRMTAKRIIGNRDVLVERPPDILLTNYKMLDYLLSRPRDQRLWTENGPETLKWLVVDELHTFDGAQGTDLACLIRRLKSRLGTSGEGLTCVGTSATLGPADEDDLRQYVQQVFGTRFDSGSIVGETRETIEEFLHSSVIQHFLMPQDDIAEIVDPDRYDSTEDYIRAQFELYFGEAPGHDFLSNEWKAQLSERLRDHASFVNLLRALDGRPKALSTVVERLRRSMPRRDDRTILGILNGLCALISMARTRGDGQSALRLRPFLRVSVHVWVRELARMVCAVHRDLDSPERRLRHSDDLTADERSPHLPLVQCHNCHVTGWGAVLNSNRDGLLRDIRYFYNQFFSRSIEAKFLFPETPPRRARGANASICGSCGRFRLDQPDGPCADCKSDRVAKVFVPDSVVEEGQGPNKRRVLSKDCPYCSSRGSLYVFGARSTVLLSVALGQTYASRHNEDHKVVGFSDNVQDAAHRAGFFSHRTWRNSKRAAIAQAVPRQGSISLAELPATVTEKWREQFGRKRFVSEFIAPDRTWRTDFSEFRETGKLGSSSRLPNLVSRRLQWEALAEFGFASSIAHSLERSRFAAAGPSTDALHGACVVARDRLREELSELQDITQSHVQWIALGILRRLKDTGAIASETVDAVKWYIHSGCSRWYLTRIDHALPEFGPESPRPIFPAEDASGSDGTEPLTRLGGTSWYQRLVEKVLYREFPLVARHHSGTILGIILKQLQSQDLVRQLVSKELVLWAIQPEGFLVSRRPAVLQAKSPTRALVVPADEAPLWKGAPCYELGVPETYVRIEERGPTWAGRMYAEAKIRRIVAEEHTALLARKDRELLQSRFIARDARPGDPNMLSATPTLELGIDIGDLSTVALCSVPPAQANYIQRIGRAGRRDGNAFTVTLAAAQPHDLFFYQEPLEMLDGAVAPPGVFLNASAVLERQLTAFCLDNWSAACNDPDAVPRTVRPLLDRVESQEEHGFPYTFFAYVSENVELLLSRFLAAFREDLEDDSRDYLALFLKGSLGGKPRLIRRILDCLEHRVRERKAIERDVRRISETIRVLRRRPEDEATKLDIEQHTRERIGLRRLLRKINSADTFSWLTDEGLIPNYAFPQEGVKLRSVILRSQPTEEAGMGLPAESTTRPHSYEYLRPAAAALRELAPSNRFYAGGHRVQIDRVDIDVSNIERWRLCPSCTYCQRIDEGDSLNSCPRCGDPMWSDAGQKSWMLPLKLVHATTNARRAQIMDDRDDRESVFFTNHLVADLNPAAQQIAYAVPEPGPPFSFTYFHKTTFREMNFGRLNKKAQTTKFAGIELPREGFRICRHCGKVQTKHLGDSAEHTSGCRVSRLKSYHETPSLEGFGDKPLAEDPAMIDCLYLYREFESEAVRMVVPEVEFGKAGSRSHSFIAAVELGLREHFQGRIDHLRVMSGDAPVDEGSARQNYLVLYDTVPGGTGYLKELTREPANIETVFQLALERLRACDCDDGCYRCVFAYRRRRDLPQTSKRKAIETVTKLVEHLGDLRKVDQVQLGSDSGSGLAESALERRFIRALERKERERSDLRIRREIVRGKMGHVLIVGEETWYVEPQADLSWLDGVTEASRPDYLIAPATDSQAKRSVAVFLDGFQYHKDRIGEDSLKRLAIVRGGYLQWSLTWDDLNIAFGIEEDFEDLLRAPRSGGRESNSMVPLQKALDSRWSTGPLRSRLRLASLDLLLDYLSKPDAEKWQQAVFTEVLRVFDQGEMNDPRFRAEFEKVTKERLPAQAIDAVAALSGQVFRAGRGQWRRSGGEFADLFVALSGGALQQGDSTQVFAAVHLHDLRPHLEGFRKTWNGVLRLYNLLQFLPNSWWTATTAVRQGGYPEFVHPADDPIELSAEWKQAIEQVDDDLRQSLRTLAAYSIQVPDIGYELVNQSGMVVAEAEAAWVDRRVAILMPDRSESAGPFQAAGWRVLEASISADGIRAALAGAAKKES